MFALATIFLASSKLRESCALFWSSSESASFNLKALCSIGGQQTVYNDRHDVDVPETVSRQSRFDAWIYVLLRLNCPSSRKMVRLFTTQSTLILSAGCIFFLSRSPVWLHHSPLPVTNLLLAMIASSGAQLRTWAGITRCEISKCKQWNADHGSCLMADGR